MSVSFLNALADALAAATADLGAQVGTVTGTSGTQVVVTVRGASLTLPRLASYTPTAGDAVIVLPIGNGQKIVLGKPA